MKKKILLIIALILILVPAFIFLVPIKDGRTFYQNIIYQKKVNAGLQPENYDKMKISYARIVERQTGIAPFDSESDMNGHDSTDTDNYIRTYDELRYTLEVGIDRNEYTTEQSDSFTGGIIRVKVTVPAAAKKYLGISTENWMQSSSVNNDDTQLTTYYSIPSDKLPVGGNQQLTFSFYTTGNKGIITEDLMPTFEIWMEGNKPDNRYSSIDSVIVHDTDELNLTGSLELLPGLSSGSVNMSGKMGETRGRFVDFYYTVGIPSKKGSETPQNIISESMRIEYYYKNKNGDGNWIKLDTVEPDNPINNTILYAWGRPCETINGYYPNGYKPNPSGYGLCASYKYIRRVNGTVTREEYNSGVMTAELQGTTINANNTGFYDYSNEADGVPNTKVIRQVYELFVPYYEPEPGEYDYQIKIINDRIESEDYLGNPYSVEPNYSYTINFSNYLNGKGSIWFSSQSAYYNADNEDGFTSFSHNNDLEPLPINKRRGLESSLDISDGPYEGGLERLVAWNAKDVELAPFKPATVEYLLNGSSLPVPTTQNVIIEYGIYKENSQEGLTTNEMTEIADFEDFDWYGSLEEAKSHGKVTAILTKEPDYRGFKHQSRLIFNLTPISINSIGATGIARHRYRLYGDEEKTKVYSFGYDKSYAWSRFNEDRTGLARAAYPPSYGEGFYIVGFTNSISTILIDHNNTSSYNVEEEDIKIKVTPNFVTGIENLTGQTNFKIRIVLPNYLTYKNSSLIYDPVSINTRDTGEQEIVWELNDWDLETPLPVFTVTASISPYTPNNSSLWIHGYLSSTDTFGEKDGFAHVQVTNLSGSSLRQLFDKEIVEKQETIKVDSYLYNIAQRNLQLFKSVELLPKNGDAFGSHYSGDYTLKVIGLAENQKMYYTINSIDNIGLEEDSIGKQNIRNVDLPNDSRWIEVQMGDIIPSNATAIATSFPEVPESSEIHYEVELIPNGNNNGDKYYFQLIGSSDNLENSITSEVKQIAVVDRQISGTVFEDLNRNDLLNETDARLNNVTIELLNESGIKIDETTTDIDGHYVFDLLDNGNYYIRVTNLPNGYEILPKGTNTDSNCINSTLVSDLINHIGTPHNPTETITVNYGIRKKPATLVVKYLDKNNNQPLADQTETTVYYTDPYETHGLTNIPANYSFLENAGAPVADIVNSDYIEVIYYYDYTPATVTARYYIDGTNTKVHEDIVQNKKFTQSYSTDQLTIQNYDYVRTDGDSTSGTISKETYVVNYYYRLKKGTVTTHHYLYNNGDTTTKLAPDVTREWNYTETYTTSTSNQVPQNYEFYKKTNNYTNIMNSPSVEVNYYYQLKDSNLTTSIEMAGTEEITSKNDKVEYEITYNAKVVDYIGVGTITIVETLPYAIDVDNSDLDGGTYNASDKTITWTEDWNGIDSYNNNNQKAITKNIKLVYVGIVGRDRIMTNTTTGTITLSNNSREAQAQTSTNIRINGNIKVIYVDQETREEIETAVEETNLIGEEFISSAIEKDGYKLVTKPDSETFEFEEEDQLITYEYEHIKYEIRAVVQGVGGRISGDEDVYWGEDSTLDNIVIEADDGYIIEAIYINGVRQELVLGEERVVLSNFINVLENKNIEVVFAKKPQENPNTKASLGWIILVSWLIFFTLVILLKKTKELE